MNPENGHILRLPDEILVVILETASEHDSKRPVDCIRYSYASCKSLALVCHRFNRIVAPFLYHTIKFNVSAPLRKLHTTLQRNESLRQYCRAVFISIDDQNTATCDAFSRLMALANDIVSWLPKTQHLDLHGGFTVVFQDESDTKATWQLLRYVSIYMRELRRLDLHRNYWGVHLSDLMRIHIPSLEELNIKGMSSSSYSRIPMPASYPENIVIPMDKKRTASFRKLHLSYFRAIPTTAFEIINWSKHLTHFKLSFFMSRYPLYLQDLNTCLLHHQYTLRSIDLGYLSSTERRHRFYAVDFPNLEELTLSRWLMDTKGFKFTSADADALLAPNLHTFHLNFTLLDYRPEKWDDVGEQEEQWLRGLARAAIARRAALKRIRVTFTPRSWYVGDTSYPWDRLDRVRDEVVSDGVVLEYNQPTISKEEWSTGVCTSR